MTRRAPPLYAPSKRLLLAIEAAVLAMLAGVEGQGDWPDDVSRLDLEDASSWVTECLDHLAVPS